MEESLKKKDVVEEVVIVTAILNLYIIVSTKIKRNTRTTKRSTKKNLLKKRSPKSIMVKKIE